MTELLRRPIRAVVSLKHIAETFSSDVTQDGIDDGVVVVGAASVNVGKEARNSVGVEDVIDAPRNSAVPFAAVARSAFLASA